ncbi:MAG TPA: chaperone NapD [Burkholderiales bacterium]|nr:chaperone NapD [Burkholderiales bacterium]
MDISSAVVSAMPCSREDVRAQLEALPGVEIHAETPDGRFIVTVEDTPGVPAADTVMRLHSMRGVLAATMVYQYSDDALDTKEDSP